MKLLVHVGLHRSGSTSLQNWLAARRSAWAEHRVFVHGRVDLPFAIMASRQAVSMGAPAVADYVRASLHELGNRFDAGIVSDENLLGPIAGPRQPPFQWLAMLCRTLDHLGEHHDVVPVIVLRGHVAWLGSLYRTYQSRGGTKCFRQFLAQSKAADLRFAPVLARLAKNHSIIVDSVEQFGRDGGARLLQRITGELHVPSAGLSLPHDNAAQSSLHLRITAALGAHHALLAGHGGPDMDRAEAFRLRELAKLLHDRAVRVAWTAPAGRRMNRATAIHRKGTPPDRRIGHDICRAIVAEALAATPESLDTSTLPLDAFAADRQTVAETWLPEWRTKAL